jgi:hypothetical protein
MKNIEYTGKKYLTQIESRLKFIDEFIKVK